MITPIEKIQVLNPSLQKQTEAVDLDGNIFGSILRSAIENVRTTNAEKTQAEYLLATGQLDNPAEYVIAAGKSSLAMDLLVQLRTRAVEAYQQLTNLNG